MNSRIFRILAVLTVVSMIMAACGGAATPAPEPTQAPAQPTPAPVVEATKAPEPAEPGDCRCGGEGEARRDG